MSGSVSRSEDVSVIIVDDEPLVREGLQYSIDWGKLGCSVVGLAENGIDGIELVKNVHPDIVITDIMMPGIDGLEFTGFITGNYPYTQVIILTGYDEFAFAQEAIRAGAADFVLKPTKSAELEKIIMNKKEKISKRRRETEEQLEIKKRLETGATFLRTKFIADLLKGHNIDIREVKHCLSCFNIEFTCYSILLLGSCEKGNISRSSAAGEEPKYTDLLEIILARETTKHGFNYISMSDECLYSIILYPQTESDIKIFFDRFKNFYNDFKLRISNEIPFPIRVAASSPSDDITIIQSLFDDTRKKLGTEVHIGDETIFISKNNSVMISVIEYIDKHYSQNMTLKDIADNFYLSPGHLCRLIKSTTSRTFIDLLTHVRIAKAKTELKSPSVRVCEVAQSVGFSDSRYFSQVFKDIVGMTPTEYRNT